jgi:hypothetical protein
LSEEILKEELSGFGGFLRRELGEMPFKGVIGAAQHLLVTRREPFASRFSLVSVGFPPDLPEQSDGNPR